MADITLQPAVTHDELLAQVRELLRGERNALANMANLSSLLFHSLAEVNWAGFYLRRGNELVLGPFQGKPACVRIRIGQGVCGAAAQRGETVVVADVHAFPGHIACDADSRSEIVAPLRSHGEIAGVLDVDSPVPSRFGEEDRVLIESCARLLIEGSDGWEALFSVASE